MHNISICTDVHIASHPIATTLEPHYNTHFGVFCDMSVIAEQPYNEGLIHRKYKQWEPMPVGCYKQMSAIKEGVIMRLQCISGVSIPFVSKKLAVVSPASRVTCLRNSVIGFRTSATSFLK